MSSFSWAVTEFSNSIPTRPSFFFRGNEWHVMWVAVGVFGVLLVDGHGFATIDLKLMKVWKSLEAPYFPHPESIMKYEDIL